MHFYNGYRSQCPAQETAGVATVAREGHEGAEIFHLCFMAVASLVEACQNIELTIYGVYCMLVATQ